MVTHAGCIRGILSELLDKDLSSIIDKVVSHKIIVELEIKNNKIISYNLINSI